MHFVHRPLTSAARRDEQSGFTVFQLTVAVLREGSPGSCYPKLFELDIIRYVQQSAVGSLTLSVYSPGVRLEIVATPLTCMTLQIKAATIEVEGSMIGIDDWRLSQSIGRTRNEVDVKK
jgi:hypothetical protein